MQKRNPAVEFMRIAACLIVICCHSNFYVVLGAESGAVHSYLVCCFSDGVGVFWMITGFFLFQNSDYAKLWKHTLKKVVLPATTLFLFTFYLSDAFVSGASLTDSISHTPEETTHFIYRLLTFNEPAKYCGHTWYIFAYILLILIFPLLKAFVDYLDESPLRQGIFIAVSFLLLVVNDCFANAFLDFGYHTIGAVIPASIEVVWGHIIYHHRQALKKKALLFVSLPGFFILNGLRYQLQTLYSQSELGSSILSWFTSIGFLCSLCVVIAGFYFVNEAHDSIWERFLCKLAGYTFPIYLMHPLVQEWLVTHSFWNALSRMLSPYMGANLLAVITVLSGTLVTFIISLCISFLLRFITRALYHR